MVSSVTNGHDRQRLAGRPPGHRPDLPLPPNWRPTLIIGLAIPLSIITTFIALYFAGYTLNLLTLGGLALGIGMLVDNAIVVIENMFRHVQEGADAKKAAMIGRLRGRHGHHGLDADDDRRLPAHGLRPGHHGQD